MVASLVAGNWKMNGVRASLSEATKVVERLAQMPDKVDCLLCPPATLIMAMAALAGPRLKVGAQSCHPERSGAHTGDLSAEMLVDAGARYIIVGHSERRDDHVERSAYVQEQADAALRAGATPIVCVGENYQQRRRGETNDVIQRLMSKSLPRMAFGATNLVVAYEPKWAIGTGQVPTLDEIAEVHALIRSILVETYGAAGARMQTLYGGSVKPGNAREIFAVENVNGGLIGGASLKADEFMAIYAAAVG